MFGVQNSEIFTNFIIHFHTINFFSHIYLIWLKYINRNKNNKSLKFFEKCSENSKKLSKVLDKITNF